MITRTPEQERRREKFVIIVAVIVGFAIAVSAVALTARHRRSDTAGSAEMSTAPSAPS